jgi:hypothetical protein
MNISEFERDKPKETLKQINLLIAMQQDADKRLHGNEGACVDGQWHVFKDEFDKLKQLFLQGQ